MLGSVADAVSSGSCPILFKVLTLNVAICNVRFHFSNFCLSSVADFSNTEARAPTSAGRAAFLPTKSDAVWTGGLGVGHGCFYSHLQKPPLSTSSSSSLIEIFDPGRRTVGFIRPGSG